MIQANGGKMKQAKINHPPLATATPNTHPQTIQKIVKASAQCFISLFGSRSAMGCGKRNRCLHSRAFLVGL